MVFLSGVCEIAPPRFIIVLRKHQTKRVCVRALSRAVVPCLFATSLYERICVSVVSVRTHRGINIAAVRIAVRAARANPCRSHRSGNGIAFASWCGGGNVYLVALMVAIVLQVRPAYSIFRMRRKCQWQTKRLRSSRSTFRTCMCSRAISCKR